MHLHPGDGRAACAVRADDLVDGTPIVGSRISASRSASSRAVPLGASVFFALA